MNDQPLRSTAKRSSRFPTVLATTAALGVLLVIVYEIPSKLTPDPSSLAGVIAARPSAAGIGGTAYYFSDSGCPGAPITSVASGTISLTFVVDWDNMPAGNVPDRAELYFTGRRGNSQAALDLVHAQRVLTRTGDATFGCAAVPLSISYARDGVARYEHLAFSGQWMDTFAAGGAITLTASDPGIFTANVDTLPPTMLRPNGEDGPPQTTYSVSDTVWIILPEPCLSTNVRAVVSGPAGFQWTKQNWCSDLGGMRWPINEDYALAPGNYTVSFDDAWPTPSPIASPIAFTVDAP